MPMTLSDLKVTFAVWNLSNFYTSENTVRIGYDVFTRESNSARDL